MLLIPMFGFAVYERRSREAKADARLTTLEGKVADIPLNYPTKETLTQFTNGWREELERLRGDGRLMHNENSSILVRIEDKVGDIATIAVRLERAEKDVQDIRDWKHEKADPHIAEIARLNDRLNRLEESER